jgi:hypothetical protein
MEQLLQETEDITTAPIDPAHELRSLNADQLLERWKAGTVPDTIRMLDGDPRGLGIALHILTGSWFERWLKRYSLKETFPWHGKSFRSTSDTEGWGWNRIAIGPILDIFPFKTRIGTSAVDGKQSIILDFNVPRNPWWERLTWDELREVEPGVFLGLTTLRLFGRQPIMLWFAVDTTRDSEWHGA